MLLDVQPDLYESKPEQPISVKDISQQTDDWLANQRAAIRIQLAEQAKKEEELRTQRDEIDKEFIKRFNDRGTSGTRTSMFSISMRLDDAYPEIEDRTEFEKYLLATKKLHLLQKRLSLTAIKEELALMETDKQGWIEYLNKNQWNLESCKKLLQYSMNEEKNIKLTEEQEVLLNSLNKNNNLKPYISMLLDNMFIIPGITITARTNITQIKR